MERIISNSKEGYEPIEEVRVTWKNDMVNRSPIVKMKLLNANKSLSWMWWGIINSKYKSDKVYFAIYS
ncbi:MAG TPA: hypothetical protein DCR38_05700 [Butyricimonas virosa]|nr:hypothetical protein [Butyricimonas virosa]